MAYIEGNTLYFEASDAGRVLGLLDRMERSASEQQREGLDSAATSLSTAGQRARGVAPAAPAPSRAKEQPQR